MKRAFCVLALAACTRAPEPAAPSNTAPAKPPSAPTLTGDPAPAGVIVPPVAREVAIQLLGKAPFQRWKLVVTVDQNDPRIAPCLAKRRPAPMDAADCALELYSARVKEQISDAYVDGYQLEYKIQNGALFVACRSDAPSATDPTTFVCDVNIPGG